MLEMLLNPRKAERHPWEMLLLGLFYGSMALLLVNWIFSSDAVLSKYSGILVVTFTVMFSLPFMYYLIKTEEKKQEEYNGMLRVLKEHSRALLALLWFFLGLVIAFSFWNVVLGENQLFDAQIRTYCLINNPENIDKCVADYSIEGGKTSKTTGFISSGERVLSIFSNNIYVLIFTLVFSLIFGAGAIFILAWNASVIAVAVGVFTKYNLVELPIGVARYMIHGFPEIASYFIGALAGGIISIAIIKRKDSEKFWSTIKDSLSLVILAIIILIIAALIEVFITPSLF
ncbi:stage II sporulation protein M [Candidatus Pacearchaeota archaeon]|nr:stage II sporulation protein M [Candidatus Pacearchaeota archaeon]